MFLSFWSITSSCVPQKKGGLKSSRIICLFILKLIPFHWTINSVFFCYVNVFLYLFQIETPAALERLSQTERGTSQYCVSDNLQVSAVMHVYLKEWKLADFTRKFYTVNFYEQRERERCLYLLIYKKCHIIFVKCIRKRQLGHKAISKITKVNW